MTAIPTIWDFAAGPNRATLLSMRSEQTRRRARERIEALADAPLDAATMRLEAIEILRAAIGFERWCALLLDPDTLIVSHGLGRNDWPAELPRLNLIGAGLDDVNNHTILARSRDHVGVLSAATGSDLSRSQRWREVFSRYGVGDELRCVATDASGSWADVMLFRDSDDPSFDAEDARLMREVSEPLARGLRRGAASPLEHVDPVPSETGVLLLDASLRPIGATGAAQSWLRTLEPAEWPFPDGVPGAVWNVVGRLLAIESGQEPGRPPRLRARTPGGGWAIVEAARLDGGSDGIAVTIRPAGTDEVLDLVCRASGLTPRERELVALLVEGLDTREVAARLFISRYTVQDHLKSVFDKMGVRSRRELVSGILGQAA